MRPSRQVLLPIVRKVVIPLLLNMAIIMAVTQSGSVHVYASSHSQHSTPNAIDPNRPVLAFYYAWYHQSDWCSCHMSDLPIIQYNSADDSTIDRQLNWATNAGISGFISSWWGIGDQTDTNFAKLLAHSATLEQNTGYHFASTIYFESDSPNLQGETTMVNALKYVVSNYTNDPHFLRWHGKPILFFWDPLGNGRTLSLWSSIRQQVDPGNQMYWSAEGLNMSLLDVFDGIHLFSAGYWGLLDGNMQAVDQGFRDEINAYNAIHNTQKIWTAGVMPGYDDTHVPGRKNPFKVPRNNGSTYHASWDAAIASSPDWITITSFNEWFEGSTLEPSKTYNMQYLDITQQYTQQWHGK
jgi:hypothetical protein